jgi:hypothetical protein
MMKGDSKLTKDLERLQQRLQSSRRSLHQSEIKAEDLDATIQSATRMVNEARKHRHIK